MYKRKAIIIPFVLFIFVTVTGLAVVNYNLNRQIYSGILEDIKDENKAYDNKNKSRDLDMMADVLTYPEKYQIEKISLKDRETEEKVVIPKVRILYNSSPFDFRIDTNKYTFFINGNVIENIKGKALSIVDTYLE
ncbi:hypothetical protein CLHOM_03790 [Clostridium homopropionicum DSM 5847]|uniref:Uncharacterized protein n=1 Tax=Clostridium homopropionicum DSM 5847 TaxID=1121318 RepID=A0A0L6ZE43_9CLOT|nr:hypothetical protein [Clostridium homopropionicum]KOA21249.1 hypothetical protein CLHOM_03790 [Clostridium homopropionicum DSM 5847]SFG28620.1 hypothetical protein SAMN04488501_107125 [Clostridium homopropionicum]